MLPPHACDCHSVEPSPLGPILHLAVRPAAIHVSRQFVLLLHAHDVTFEAQGQVMTFGVQHLEQLQTVLKAMTEMDRQGLPAVPVTAEGPQVYDLQPLQVWVDRLSTNWFPEASRHLVFHAQPIVRVCTGEVYGYEALVRARVDGRHWDAGELLAAAAAHRQSRGFDALARTTAIRQLYPRLAPDQRLFINFAPGVVYNPDICLQTTFEACREVGADFSRLVFEITEGEAFPDLPLLRSILERYRQEGAQVALDDVGSGQTSLAYLDELRPDIVKLDRSLVQDLTRSGPRMRLLSALTNYAHDLGSLVVAEGIEQAEELAAVQAADVDLAQGFFLGRPAESLQGIPEQAASWWSTLR